jgi:hypothetical protein
VKLFRKRTPENDEGADELLDTDGAEEAAAQETPEVAPADAAEPEAVLTPDEPLAQESPEGTAPPSKPDDLFDGGLMDLFREAQNEVEESTLATDLPDIPMEDLLSDLVSVSRRLGIEPGTGSLRRANALDSDGDHRARRK